jgi:hypothetical protein
MGTRTERAAALSAVFESIARLQADRWIPPPLQRIIGDYDGVHRTLRSDFAHFAVFFMPLSLRVCAKSAELSCVLCVGVPCAVRPGTLSCTRPNQLICSSRYLFVRGMECVTAYDLTRDDLPCVWTHATNGNSFGATVALRESVLIVALTGLVAWCRVRWQSCCPSRRCPCRRRA